MSMSVLILLAPFFIVQATRPFGESKSEGHAAMLNFSRSRSQPHTFTDFSTALAGKTATGLHRRCPRKPRHFVALNDISWGLPRESAGMPSVAVTTAKTK